MPTTLYSRQFGESTEDVMLPVSSAMLGPHASRMLSAKGRSFVGGIDEQATGMIQALGVWPGQVRLGLKTVSGNYEGGSIGFVRRETII
jgi:hypothetical protein